VRNGRVSPASHQTGITRGESRNDASHALLPCAKDEAAVVGYLRSTRPAFLTRIDEVIELRDAA
jgi:hypothetical protein